jgi:hypothetical protein
VIRLDLGPGKKEMEGGREEWDRAEERGGSGGHNGAAGQNDAIGETGNDHGIFITALSILKTNILLMVELSTASTAETSKSAISEIVEDISTA